MVDSDKPLRSLVFKIMDDRYGALTFIRIYSGKIEKGMNVLNTYTGKSERIGRIVEMHADSRNDLDEAGAGDIVAVLGMKNVQTGHTLLTKIRPPWSRWFFRSGNLCCYSAEGKGRSRKTWDSLRKNGAGGSSFRVETDQESNETIIKGMGELHLDIKVDILRRTHSCEVEVGKPQVAYRETITKVIEDEYTHKKQTEAPDSLPR